MPTYHVLYIISKSTDVNYAHAAPNSIKGPVQLSAEARKIRQAVFNVEEIEIYPHLAANHTKELHKPDTDPAELLWKQFRYTSIQPNVLSSPILSLSVWLHNLGELYILLYSANTRMWLWINCRRQTQTGSPHRHKL